MKQLFAIVILLVMILKVSAQDSGAKIIEKRAKEFHRVIGLNDKEQWKKFIAENYSQALIDKPMKSVVQTSDQKSTASAQKKTESIDDQTSMFQRLHQDFGNSKILSLKPKDENFEMILENTAGLTGTFNFKFDKKEPYLIDGIGIEVGR